MKVQGRMRGVMLLVAISLGGLVVLSNGCALFEDERTAKGRKIYHHYCQHCHGESGRQNEGFNWGTMPDPRPRDLSEKAAMSTFSDEEIFNTISRDMRDTSDPAVENDENYFAVSTMPTFKFTLSGEELWAVVAYVRSLHGMDLTFDVEGQKKELESNFNALTQEFEAATQVLEAAEKKIEEAEEAAAALEGDDDLELEDDDDYEEVLLPEEVALEKVTEKYEAGKALFESFSKRPRHAQVRRPDLSMSEEDQAALAKIGKNLYVNQYGCNACHSINDVGGIVGPKLDRAGFRLNATWVYRWILYPQGMKKHTRMPNLGISTEDAKALTFYLETLRAPKPDQPIPPSV
ncbi:MAG: c-type cytochrome [Nitrospirae bacterium]|nr:c-type cytochrome [Nitrospirota bacterium]